MRETERRAVVAFFDEALSDVDEILRGTTHLLSRLTRYASLALAPRAHDSPIVRCELIGLGSATLLLVVFETGQVEKRMVELPDGLAAEDLDQLSRLAMELTRGKTLAESKRAIEERPLKELAAYWGLAAIILVPIGLALIAWLLPGKD